MKTEPNHYAAPSPATAFLRTEDDKIPLGLERGFTKRERFAESAMKGLLANANYTATLVSNGASWDENMGHIIAQNACFMADRLIEALNKEGLAE